MRSWFEAATPGLYFNFITVRDITPPGRVGASGAEHYFTPVVILDAAQILDGASLAGLTLANRYADFHGTPRAEAPGCEEVFVFEKRV